MLPLGLYRFNSFMADGGDEEGAYYVYTNPRQEVVVRDTDRMFVLLSHHSDVSGMEMGMFEGDPILFKGLFKGK